MNKVVRFVLPVVAFTAFSLTSCKKCEECHYDGPNGEIELGEFCDEELEDMEANGYVADSVTYEVHCHEH